LQEESDVGEVSVRHLAEHDGQEVTVRGWVANARSSGKIAFLQVRDGSGVVQVVVSRQEVPEVAWEDARRAAQESTVTVRGRVRLDPRAPGGVAIHATDL
jgi:asparaginyl-tRNA synthetase